MKKDDYKAEFEEHRKEISLEEGHGAGNLPSRSELHRKGRKPKKRSGNTMINVVLGLFTLIPVLILVYVVSDFYSPEDSTSAKVDDPAVRYETEGKVAGGDPKETEKDIPLDEQTDDKGKVNKDDEKSAAKADAPPVAKNEAVTKPEQKPVTKPVVDVNPAPEKKPEVKPVPEKKPEQKPAGKSHKVASGETLYRISVTYYGSDVGVEKIKQANGLTSNNIAVGQTLVIP